MKNSLILLLPFTILSSAQDTTITVKATIPTNEPSYKSLEAFTSAILNTTNTYRQQHNATSLIWNTTLADFASDYLDSTCDFEHSGGPYGENLALGYPNATAAVEAWGDEREEYDFDDGDFETETGHFTQLVWKDTEEVGCGRKVCGDKGWYLVCEYWPRGNVEGSFQEEVQEQESSASRGYGWIACVVIICYGMIGVALLEDAGLI